MNQCKFFGTTEATLVERGTRWKTETESSMHVDTAQCLVDAIHETLQMFGQRTSQQVYGYLEKRFALKKDEIPNRLMTFSRGLNNLFGSASKLIELSVVKKFYSKLGMKFEHRIGFDFVGYIAAPEAMIRI